MAFDREELKRGLLAGETLEVSTGGGSYDMWVEPFANPPAVFYEGRVLPYGALDSVLDQLVSALERGEVRCHWAEPRGAQVKACEEAYRSRARETLDEKS